MRQWYESTQGGLIGHAAGSGGVSKIRYKSIDEAPGENLLFAPRGRYSLAVRAKALGAAGASAAAEDVCDTARRDRDGGYPCL